MLKHFNMNIFFTLLIVVTLASFYVPHLKPSLSITIPFCMVATLAYQFIMRTPNKIYLVDFACFKPSLECLCSKEMLLDRAKRVGFLSDENYKLVNKILDRSGLGPWTYVPEGLLEIPPRLTLEEARKETDTVLFGAVDELLEKTGVEAKDIGVLVVNCCLFNPTPSLSDSIVNRYKLRGNILAYNLSGMGCSAGVLAVDFAKQLLQVLSHHQANKLFHAFFVLFYCNHIHIYLQLVIVLVLIFSIIMCMNISIIYCMCR